MRVKRCSLIIIAAFILFLSTAYFLDTPGLLIISVSLWIFLGCRYFLFFSRLKIVARSVQTTRTVDRLLTRQGMSSNVTTKVTMIVKEGVSALYEEMMPSGVSPDNGDSQTHPISAGFYTFMLTYRIIPRIYGNITFPGGILSVWDPFFEMKIPLSNTMFAGPVLHVQPSPVYEKIRFKSQFGEKETRMVRVQHGQIVKSYRKYLRTDDHRIIDWKMSAKYDSLYVREYTCLENDPPLIIIDLPDRDQDFDLGDFSKLVQVVSAYVERTLKEGSLISLLIISGPNIISTLFNESDIARYMTIIREHLHPHIRFHHFYRIRQKKEIRDEIKKLHDQKEKEEDEDIIGHLSLLTSIYQRHLLDNSTNHFSAQISRLFSSIRTDEISLFSLCDGDISYIHEIARQARFSKFGFRIKTPHGRNVLTVKPRCHELKGEIIEGIL